MSVSGQVSATGPPHRRTRGPKRRVPALNSTDARACDRSPNGTAPHAAPAGIPVTGNPRPPTVPRHRAGTRQGEAAHGRPGGAGPRGAGVMALLSIPLPPFRAVPGIAPKKAPDEECDASRAVRTDEGTRHDRGTRSAERFSAPSERMPGWPFRRRWRRKRAVFGHRPPDVQETTFPHHECTSRASIPTKKRECAQRGRGRAAPPPSAARSPGPVPRPTRPPPGRPASATG